MSDLKRTQLYDVHVAAGATMVDFGGWDMPIQYPTGILAEHLYCRSVCGIFIFRPKIKGDQSVDSHAETDGNGVDEILDRIDQRQSRHGVFTDSGDKVAVHDIVKGIDQHGDYHGKRHGHD